MKKSIYSPKAKIVVERLKELRKKAGLTQRDLAVKLEVPRGTIGRIELGDRRVDVAEFHTILEVLGVNPEREFRAIAKSFSNL
jgi:transcriptional regulator with XRE-family HTH domain